ncbi:hypothetical protein FA10DRAFT_64986 [Acaromyces ingoldii]|uniref:Palmitoyltransferase ERF2 n=1 Tax=Acaromyces ingoldii TaxID=215250 RepID=A0A316YQP0_9BASI|nr:hypothetical protein FA10DRAFT_64986 [Acaromyces ingoldii]PWN91336.1 hypothetical protein FA10DRAFT_64986 [Acaromyces ingoldii]
MRLRMGGGLGYQSRPAALQSKHEGRSSEGAGYGREDVGQDKIARRAQTTRISADEQYWQSLRQRAGRSYEARSGRVLRHSQSYGAPTHGTRTWISDSHEYHRHAPDRPEDSETNKILPEDQLQASSSSSPLRRKDTGREDWRPTSWHHPRSAPISPTVTFPARPPLSLTTRNYAVSPSQRSSIESLPKGAFSPEAALRFEKRLEEQQQQQLQQQQQRQPFSSSSPTQSSRSPSHVSSDHAHGGHDYSYAPRRGEGVAKLSSQTVTHRRSASRSLQLEKMQEEGSGLSKTEDGDRFLSAHSSPASIGQAFHTPSSLRREESSEPMSYNERQSPGEEEFSGLSPLASSLGPAIGLMKRWWREEEAAAKEDPQRVMPPTQSAEGAYRSIESAEGRQGSDPPAIVQGQSRPVFASERTRNELEQMPTPSTRHSSLPSRPQLPIRKSSRGDGSSTISPRTIELPLAHGSIPEASGLVSAASLSSSHPSTRGHNGQRERAENDVEDHEVAPIPLPETPLKRQQFYRGDHRQASEQAASALFGSEQGHYSESGSPSSGSELTTAGSRTGVGLGIDLRSFDGSGEDFSQLFFFDGRKPRPRGGSFGAGIYHAHGNTNRASLSAPLKNKRARAETPSSNFSSPPKGTAKIPSIPAEGEAGPSNWEGAAKGRKGAKAMTMPTEPEDTLRRSSSFELVAGPGKARRRSRLSSDEEGGQRQAASKAQASQGENVDAEKMSHQRINSAIGGAGQHHHVAPTDEEARSASEVEAFVYHPEGTGVRKADVEHIEQHTVSIAEFRRVVASMQLLPPVKKVKNVAKANDREQEADQEMSAFPADAASAARGRWSRRASRYAMTTMVFLFQVLVIALFFVFEAPFLWSAFSPAAAVAPIYLFLGTAVSFVCAAATDPGTIPLGLHQYTLKDVARQTARPGGSLPLQQGRDNEVVITSYLSQEVQDLDDDSPRKKMALAKLRQQIKQAAAKASPTKARTVVPVRTEVVTKEAQGGRRTWLIYRQDEVDNVTTMSHSNGFNAFFKSPCTTSIKRWRQWRRETALRGLHRPVVDMEQQPVPREIQVGSTTLRCRYCDVCDIYPPPRAFHCSICRRCCLHNFGHCRWIGADVGSGNLAFFLGFLIFAALSLSYVTVFAALHLAYLARSSAASIPGLQLVSMSEEGVGSFRNALRAAPVATILFLFSVPSFLIVTSYFFKHLTAARRGQTTVQR